MNAQGVNLTGRGWVPYCETCEYVGKPRERETQAKAAVQAHVNLPVHRMRALGAARRERAAA